MPAVTLQDEVLGLRVDGDDAQKVCTIATDVTSEVRANVDVLHRTHDVGSVAA